MNPPLRKGTDPLPTPIEAKNDLKDAWAAQRDVTSQFVDAVQQGDEIRRLVSEFRGIRERNGFGILIKKSMGLR